jgi:hypothetical protein
MLDIVAAAAAGRREDLGASMAELTAVDLYTVRQLLERLRHPSHGVSIPLQVTTTAAVASHISTSSIR